MIWRFGWFGDTVSIHTPTKGVTYSPRLASRCARSFNPHTHEGCDVVIVNILEISDVSIHTPTKGVTIHVLQQSTLVPCFNPHTHEGCDWQKRYIVTRNKCFNPHTHEGCDSLSRLLHYTQQVSIHTPTKGVTPKTLPLSLKQ